MQRRCLLQLVYSNIIEGNADKSKYDAEIKKMLGDKTVLAWILKYSVEEFKEYSIEVIRDCIEGEPEIGIRKVIPGHTPEAISGMPNEDKVPGEGWLTYDVRFYVITPEKISMKLIINVEGQKNYYPGYDLVTRAIFYCARLVSSQLDTEFTTQNYDEIKKVYSIWICMDVPKYLEYTITRYKMKKEDIYGHTKENARYDLMEAVMICLGKEEHVTKGNPLHGMLTTLLSETLKPKEKKEILKEQYHFVTSVELEGDLERMCNLSERIEEKAMQKGIQKGIQKGELLQLVSLVKKGILSLEIALQEVAEENRAQFLEMFQKR